MSQYNVKLKYNSYLCTCTMSLFTAGRHASGRPVDRVRPRATRARTVRILNIAHARAMYAYITARDAPTTYYRE